MDENKNRLEDRTDELRKDKFVDEDRMVNEGLGGGYITNKHNGRIDETTVDSMDQPESIEELGHS